MDIFTFKFKNFRYKRQKFRLFFVIFAVTEITLVGINGEWHPTYNAVFSHESFVTKFKNTPIKHCAIPKPSFYWSKRFVEVEHSQVIRSEMIRSEMLKSKMPFIKWLITATNHRRHISWRGNGAYLCWSLPSPPHYPTVSSVYQATHKTLVVRWSYFCPCHKW